MMVLVVRERWSFCTRLDPEELNVGEFLATLISVPSKPGRKHVAAKQPLY
jgi:hypothetical protein